MQKLIVTHHSPDFDGIPGIWLLKKFHPDFADAKVAFVPAGETYNNMAVDSDENIVHVDTGMGKFDHHQSDDFTCGAQLVYEFLVKEGYVKADDEALKRLIQIITELDHGWDNYKWPEAENDRYEFMFHNILTGWKMVYPHQEENYIDWTTKALESIYKLLSNKVAAEKELESGRQFVTRWGKGVAVYTANDAILDSAIKNGYAVVARKDPGKGYLRVTGSNRFNVDFTKAYETFKKKDPDATWFLHASKVLLRNGSTRNPKMRPTKLGVDEVVEVLEKA